MARVGKYIPSEVVAFVIFTNGVLQQSITNAARTTSGANSIATMAGFNVVDIGALILAGAWLITPIYLWRLKEPGDAWRTNAFLAFLLFPVWAYAIDGVGMRKFIEFDGYLASIVLGAATLASGLIKPSAETNPGNPPH
ncbi:hypothetical protein [Methylobacterium trifolii]|uniref:SPW repeat-containing protein n=1 Tax=Methylobacterium trifolii TaxID=1003092 RepID=A0ABQ4U7T0_9HYPH|nr:hypothetical protein [Methylobacterium trifolii]GJE62438.1 hypothetical protein MPOCJGCO_4571 [Methylobacterium trifolii]